MSALNSCHFVAYLSFLRAPAVGTCLVFFDALRPQRRPMTRPEFLLMTPSQTPSSPQLPDQFTKVLEAFCTVASRFEKDTRQVGVSEVTHLIAVAREAAEQALIAHQKTMEVQDGQVSDENADDTRDNTKKARK
jgi:hypothetical protein